MKLQHTFTITHESSLDGKVHTGVFTCSKRTVMDTSKIRVRTIQLSGGLNYDSEVPGQGLDAQTYVLNTMIATLEVQLVTKPEWFNLNEIVDVELLEAVYREVSAFEDSFRKRVTSGGSSSEGSSENKAQANRSRESKALVGSEVEAALIP